MARLMLYKKIHRQYIREFRDGRRFKFGFDGNECIYEVQLNPYIGKTTILVGVIKGHWTPSGLLPWDLIHTSGHYKGRILSGGNIAWLGD